MITLGVFKNLTKVSRTHASTVKGESKFNEDGKLSIQRE